jgi:hypothetical protein
VFGPKVLRGEAVSIQAALGGVLLMYIYRLLPNIIEWFVHEDHPVRS